MTPAPYHSVLLVGFMGSGKTTVGRRVAALLEWDFVDLDDLVEARAGRSVEEIFREEGEPAFRRLEAEAAEEALGGPGRVLAPGGGWAVPAGRLEALDPGVLTVWLRVDAETAVRRAEEDGRVRPLLQVADPVERARRLLEKRRASYGKALLHMDTTSSPPERLARDIVRHVRTGGTTA